MGVELQEAVIDTSAKRRPHDDPRSKDPALGSEAP